MTPSSCLPTRLRPHLPHRLGHGREVARSGDVLPEAARLQGPEPIGELGRVGQRAALARVVEVAHAAGPRQAELAVLRGEDAVRAHEAAEVARLRRRREHDEVLARTVAAEQVREHRDGLGRGAGVEGGVVD